MPAGLAVLVDRQAEIDKNYQELYKLRAELDRLLEELRQNYKRMCR